MLQYDSDKNAWSGLLVDINNARKGIINIGEEANSFFKMVSSDNKDLSFLNTIDGDGFNDFIKQNELADESLVNFLKDTSYAQKDLASYQLYLKNTGKATSTFATLTKKAGSIIKSFGATLVSMGVSWLAGEVFGLLLKLGDALITTMEEHQEQLKNLQQEYDEAKQNLEDVNSQIVEYENKIKELEGKTLTPVEDEELQRIKNLNEQLKIEKEVLEEIEKIKKGETSDKAIETINSKKGGMTRMEMIEDYAHSGYVNTQKEIDRIMSADYMTSEEKNYEIKYLREHQDSLRQQALEITSELLEEAKALDQNDTEAKELYDKIQALSAETLTWAKDVDTATNSVDENSNATSNAYENANKMTVSLEDLKSASEGVSTLQKAFKELSDEGYITTESISKIQEATKLSGEEWNSYQSKLLNAKAGTAEFNQVMTDLTYKILDNTFAGKDLTEVTEEQIAAVLRENGVTNASAVAHDYATRAKEAARIKTELLAGATYSEVIELAREAAQAGITGQAFLDLVVDIGILNNTALDPTQKVQALQEIGFFANWTAQQIANIGRVSRWSASGKNGLAVYDEDGNLKGVELYDDYTPPAYTPPTIPTFTGGGKSGSSGGGGSSSAKNEVLDNYLKDAENRYKIHQDETKYIKELQYAHDNLTKNDKERLDIIGKINEAYRDLADNRIKDLEHQIDLTKELKGENADVTAQYNEIQRVAHEEAKRLRAMGYDDNSNEIQDLQKTWWDAQNKKLDWRWNNSTNWIEERKTKGDWSLFGDSEVQAWERVIKWLEQDYPNALDKIKEAKNNLVDARWEHSNNWIDERNTYNDWALFNDSEVDAWERVVKWLKKDYPDDINKIKEAEQNLFEARKEQFDKANDFGSSILDSRKTLLQSYYDVTNSIAEAQHEINKELETSKTMYEWLDKETQQLLFNQTDYNTLSEELYDIQYKADKLRRQYERDLNNSTLETVESITSQYEMQYETLMKSYEIAKADLEIAKKKQQLNNVLNERNVRMFINGQWQWVANTEDVINAKAELADAEYAKQVEEAGLTQQESINNLTKQQDELSVVIKKFENGVITLGEAVDAARNAIGNLPNALNSMYNNASSGGTSKSSNRVSRLHPSVVGGSSYSTKIPNVQGNYTVNGVQYRNKYAEGTRYTSGGMTLMGEEGFEAYISSNGHLIPINQPTIGNIPSGGIVFNTEQLSKLRSLWDMSNFNINPDRSYINTQPQHIDQSQDNRIIINGMTVDSGSSDGQALINAIRRYVGNH